MFMKADEQKIKRQNR